MIALPIGHRARVTSLWLENTQPVPSDPLPEDPVDDLVVGAGITGLVTGLLLARAGRRVAVVEAREVGAVATGNTTAKISLLQGTKYSRLLRYQSHKVGLAYVDANREGMEWLLRFCRTTECWCSVDRRSPTRPTNPSWPLFGRSTKQPPPLAWT